MVVKRNYKEDEEDEFFDEEEEKQLSDDDEEEEEIPAKSQKKIIPSSKKPSASSDEWVSVNQIAWSGLRNHKTNEMISLEEAMAKILNLLEKVVVSLR